MKLIPTLSVRKETVGFKPWECSACEKFLSHSPLNRYMSCHIEYKPREHQKYHEKVYKCKDCGETFISTSALRTHKRNLTGEKFYECEQCGNIFQYEKSLQSHKNTHTGVKLCECEKRRNTLTWRSTF